MTHLQKQQSLNLRKQPYDSENPPNQLKRNIGTEMRFKEKMMNYVKKHDQNQQNNTARHSTAYHNHFAGYTEVVAPRKSGKGTRIERIYTGVYYQQELSLQKKLLLKALYLVLHAGSIVGFSTAALISVAVNYMTIVTVFQAICLPLFVWVTSALFFYLPSMNRLKIADYKSSSVRLKWSSLFLSCAMSVLAFVVLICAAVNQFRMGHTLICFVFYLLASGAQLAMSLIERKVTYTVLINPNSLPVNGVEIS